MCVYVLLLKQNKMYNSMKNSKKDKHTLKMLLDSEPWVKYEYLMLESKEMLQK